MTDLSSEQKLIGLIKQDFKSVNPDVRLSASVCLGNITIGNPHFFLQQVFQMIDQAEAKERYLFLHSIREITISKPECLSDQLDHVSKLLLA